MAKTNLQNYVKLHINLTKIFEYRHCSENNRRLSCISGGFFVVMELIKGFFVDIFLSDKYPRLLNAVQFVG